MGSAAPSRAIVDLNAYAHNLAVIHGLLPRDCKLMPVIKADGYGHGAAPLAQRALEAGAAMLGVATIEEAVELREAGIAAPILVLVQPDHTGLEAAIEHDLRLALSDKATAERLGELARRVNRVARIHCKIDTGMGRQGFNLDSAVADLRYTAHISHIDIEGIATHFPVADRPNDPFTADQIRQFKSLLKSLDKEGVPYELAHAANSAAIINYGTACFDMVRPGLATYGVWPSDLAPKRLDLKPALRWETTVVVTRELPVGASVGYGRTFTVKRPTRIAVLPVGYADGYKFALSNVGEVLIRGVRCAVCGQVSMDQIVVDVSHVPGVTLGDTAVLIGSGGAESITVEELAARAKTIPYDILTGIGRRVQRVYEGEHPAPEGAGQRPEREPL